MTPDRASRGTDMLRRIAGAGPAGAPAPLAGRLPARTGPDEPAPGRLRQWWHVNQGLLVLLAIVAGTGFMQIVVVSERAWLNFYYVPVVFGAYALGLRRGVAAAVLACAIVFGIAFLDRKGFGGGVGLAAWMRWADLITWGGFLLLTAWLVGRLHEQRESRLSELRQAYEGVLEIMAKFIDSIDRSTENHSRRVAEYSVAIARVLGLGEDEIEDVRVGAYLHDIGKIEVSTSVLRKAAGLTPEEMAEMRRHVDAGEQLVRSLGGILRNALPMIAYHHERWDGRGYKGLAGEAIPLGARIISLADTYDAIVTDRSYRARRSHDQAVAILREESGRQFDPAVVAAFLHLYEEGTGDVFAADESEPEARAA
jgi:putative nucleotidyltransferase with HDIG domain